MGCAFSVLSATVLTQPAFQQAPLFDKLGPLISMDLFTYTELNWEVTGVTLFSTLEDKKLKILEKKKLRLMITFSSVVQLTKHHGFWLYDVRERGKKLEFLAGKHFWNYAGINIYTDVVYEFFNYLFRKWLDFHVCVCLYVCKHT